MQRKVSPAGKKTGQPIRTKQEETSYLNYQPHSNSHRLGAPWVYYPWKILFLPRAVSPHSLPAPLCTSQLTAPSVHFTDTNRRSHPIIHSFATSSVTSLATALGQVPPRQTERRAGNGKAKKQAGMASGNSQHTSVPMSPSVVTGHS